MDLLFNTHDVSRDECMLRGRKLSKKGFDWWWHSFTARNAETGEERPFFLEFFVCNPALAEDAPVFGQLPANKAAGKRPSYLMVKAGCWGAGAKQLHRFFAWKDIQVDMGVPFSVTAADCFLSETELRGSVDIAAADAAAHPEWMCGSGKISWDLKIDKQVAFNVGYGANKFFRFTNAFEMYWHAEGMKTAYTGTITLDGVKYVVDPASCYGYADKNWGCGFTTPWVWLSSNNLTSKVTGKQLTDSVFDIGGGRPKAFGITLDRRLLSAFWYEGTPYEFNFSKFWTFTHTKFDSEETADEVIWHVRQDTKKAVMETEVRCFKKDMLFVNYESPDGLKRHNHLWNGGNGTATIKLYRREHGKEVLIDEIAAKNVGCEYGEYDPLPGDQPTKQ